VSPLAEERPKRPRLSVECSLGCVDVCEQWELFARLPAPFLGPVVSSERPGFGSIETRRPLTVIDWHADGDKWGLDRVV
jgi:hypothetical protein